MGYLSGRWQTESGNPRGILRVTDKGRRALHEGTPQTERRRSVHMEQSGDPRPRC